MKPRSGRRPWTLRGPCLPRESPPAGPHSPTVKGALLTLADQTTVRSVRFCPGLWSGTGGENPGEVDLICSEVELRLGLRYRSNISLSDLEGRRDTALVRMDAPLRQKRAGGFSPGLGCPKAVLERPRTGSTESGAGVDRQGTLALFQDDQGIDLHAFQFGRAA